MTSFSLKYRPKTPSYFELQLQQMKGRDKAQTLTVTHPLSECDSKSDMSESKAGAFSALLSSAYQESPSP
jgi:hypothetical protein